MMREIGAGSLADLVNIAGKLGLTPVPERPLPQPANHSLLALFPNGRAEGRDRIEIVRPLASVGMLITWVPQRHGSCDTRKCRTTPARRVSQVHMSALDAGARQAFVKP